MIGSENVDRIVFLSRWTGFADPPCRCDRVEIVRQDNGFVRKDDLRGKLEQIDPILVQAFVAAVLAPPLAVRDLTNLHLGTNWAAENRDAIWEILEGQEGMNEADNRQQVFCHLRDELASCVDGEFDSMWTDDYPSVTIALFDDQGREIRVQSDSQHSFMIPWSVQVEGGSEWKTFNAEIGRAAGDLVGADFDEYARLSGSNFISRVIHNAWSNWYFNQRAKEPKQTSREDPPSVDGVFEILLDSKRKLQNRADRDKDPNVADSVGQTVLMHAAFPPFNRERFLTLVAAGANVEARRKDGMSGLLLAASGGELQAVRAWLDAGAQVDGPGANGETPLMLALHGAWWDIIRELVAHGADVNARDLDGSTPLMYAVNGKAHADEGERQRWCNVGDLEIVALFGGMATAAELVQFLLNHGADATSRDKSDKSVITYAREKERQKRVAELVEHESRRAIGEVTPQLQIDVDCSEVCRLLASHGAK